MTHAKIATELVTNNHDRLFLLLDDVERQVYFESGQSLFYGEVWLTAENDAWQGYIDAAMTAWRQTRGRTYIRAIHLTQAAHADRLAGAALSGL